MAITTADHLVTTAESATPGISPDAAVKLASDPDVLLVDVREQGELDKAGRLESAVHLPRSHLEFKADPASPMHEPGLDGAKRLVLFCASGKRAAMAASRLKDMGFTRVEHVTGGGFDALKKAGASVKP